MAGSWIQRQSRLKQVYCVVVGELNDAGILPNGAEVKPWIRQEIKDNKVEVTEGERQMILSGLLAEKAISQEDINEFAARHLKRAEQTH
jgi:hypothetical protein